MAIDDTEPQRPLVSYVEFHSSETSEVTADVPITEQLANHSSMCKVIENRLGRVERGRLDRI
ncbi:MAG: hypothetical protein DLM55_02670 [Acidimicrobiales bacterium]|nr:MAG: hypothetical protein DLM55_02670 [Acidimicrobiales bacterium]